MKHITTSIVSMLVIGTVSFADWTPIDTFENGLGGWTQESQNVASGDITTEYGTMEIIEDPADASNHVIAVTAGPQNDENIRQAHVFSTPLPSEVPADSTAITVYQRVNSSTLNFDVAWSLSFTDENIEFWNDNEVLLRITQTEFIDVRDGSTYSNVDFVDPNTWYEIWLVVNNQANTYEAYIKGGLWTEQTRMVTLTGFDTFGFRVGTDETLKRFNLNAATGSDTNPRGRDPLIFDDIYIDYSGVNLETPTPGEGFGSWAGYPVVNEAGDVDTGSWMGWVNTLNRPWIFVYNLDGYVYLTEDAVGANGGWMYVLN